MSLKMKLAEANLFAEGLRNLNLGLEVTVTQPKKRLVLVKAVAKQAPTQPLCGEDNMAFGIKVFYADSFFTKSFKMAGYQPFSVPRKGNGGTVVFTNNFRKSGVTVELQAYRTKPEFGHSQLTACFF